MFISSLSLVVGFATVKKVCSLLGEMNVLYYGMVVEGARLIAWGYIK